jgi:hypothetical protein
MAQQLHLVIRDDGKYSDWEWKVEAVTSSMDKALARLCSLAAADFKAMAKP